MGFDLYPMDTLAVKKAFFDEAIEKNMLVFFEHDPAVAAGYISEEQGKRTGSMPAVSLDVMRPHDDIGIGIIGGSGLYDMAELTDREERTVATPFGDPSGPVRDRHAARQARRVSGAPRRRAPAAAVGAELPREHLRLQGARRRAPAVGERRRQPEGGIPAARHPRARSVLRSHQGAHQHVLRPRPRRARRLRAPVLRDAVGDRRRRRPQAVGATVHRGGTYVNMEGPQFSTLAESRLYRSWGMDVIGMTNLQEAKLAREAEICYATLALVTDYDCWHPGPRFGHGRPDHREPDAERADRAAGDREAVGRISAAAHLRAARTRSQRLSLRQRRTYGCPMQNERRKHWRTDLIGEVHMNISAAHGASDLRCLEPCRSL